MVGSVLTCLALATIAGTPASPSAVEDDQTVALSTEGRDGGERASRSYDRTAGAASDGLAVVDARVRAEAEAKKKAEAEAKKQAEAKKKAEAEAKKAEAAKKAAEAAKAAAPVAGLNETQMNNARKIVAAGQKMGLPKRAMVIAIATSLQESQLKNLASTVIPESYSYTQEGEGSDHDSVGLFQQRPSSGWGRVKDLMNPEYSATAFYKVLVAVPGWDRMALTYAAQAVQVSAYPEAYAKHEGRAQQIVDAIVP
jgi:hypothetical protein